ncbi:putative bolA-like protein C8C9.11 [Golovinomyces cichoracearum]|uniref:Putative bolA-like protein C8C9.11 n=1 Tax=Golovinomyces cichoracearum TaxID=62708 RepID=A0A420HS34_9PEZI|nr:putative bolA-like protein C8C9.11 [Golovinomyces cichoracearum]
MSTLAANLDEKIRKELDASHVEINDISVLHSHQTPYHQDGCGQAFSCVIVSPLFENKSSLARHRLVNTKLKTEIASIHAWSAKCHTPAQWTELKETEQLNQQFGKLRHNSKSP